MPRVSVVPEAGIEPACPCGRGILSPLRLPVPPLGQGRSRLVGLAAHCNGIAAHGADFRRVRGSLRDRRGRHAPQGSWGTVGGVRSPSRAFAGALRAQGPCIASRPGSLASARGAGIEPHTALRGGSSYAERIECAPLTWRCWGLRAFAVRRTPPRKKNPGKAGA